MFLILVSTIILTVIFIVVNCFKRGNSNRSAQNRFVQSIEVSDSQIEVPLTTTTTASQPNQATANEVYIELLTKKPYLDTKNSKKQTKKTVKPSANIKKNRTDESKADLDTMRNINTQHYLAPNETQVVINKPAGDKKKVKSIKANKPTEAKLPSKKDLIAKKTYKPIKVNQPVINPKVLETMHEVGDDYLVPNADLNVDGIADDYYEQVIERPIKPSIQKLKPSLRKQKPTAEEVNEKKAEKEVKFASPTAKSKEFEDDEFYKNDYISLDLPRKISEKKLAEEKPSQKTQVDYANPHCPDYLTLNLKVTDFIDNSQFQQDKHNKMNTKAEYKNPFDPNYRTLNMKDSKWDEEIESYKIQQNKDNRIEINKKVDYKNPLDPNYMTLNLKETKWDEEVEAYDKEKNSKVFPDSPSMSYF